MAHALITGGAGFIGSHLAETLLARGDSVTVIDDLSTGSFANIEHLTGNPRFRFAIESITNEVVLDRLASECNVIYHLAAAVGVQLIIQQPVHTIETNVMGTEAVFKAALRYRAKVLVASTSEVYGKSGRVPFAEDDDITLGPTSRNRWAYAATKMVDEFLALAYHREHGLPVVIFRLFNTVGPRQTGRYGMVIPRFVRQALAGEPLTVYGDGSQSRCFCNVSDSVRAIAGLAEAPDAVGRVFNIGSTEEVTILELARRTLALASDGDDNWQQQIRFISYEDAYALGFEDMQRRVPDISRIGQTIGWSPRIPLDTTLQQVIDFVK
ncbi:MAG: GDP-mannose 4,6-dehydratase [Anaerolineae bacterium]|nr:GDP-mannose 4,6-dehydratase [Anaerolineae bacterium]MCB0250479.1 GDP-mannose 4,6-dehydratase [Anaerolineae bacterium]MCO5246924.1 GDP-mannose 4,6-dehydratase [Anaerolineae bacterium]